MPCLQKVGVNLLPAHLLEPGREIGRTFGTINEIIKGSRPERDHKAQEVGRVHPQVLGIHEPWTLKSTGPGL